MSNQFKVHVIADEKLGQMLGDETKDFRRWRRVGSVMVISDSAREAAVAAYEQLLEQEFHQRIDAAIEEFQGDNIWEQQRRNYLPASVWRAIRPAVSSPFRSSNWPVFILDYTPFVFYFQTRCRIKTTQAKLWHYLKLLPSQN